jgi:pimeloyl-ACP methyl ester carboxylesterase
MEDLHAVLDAAGSERPALLGISEGGPMSVLFAATYPDRVAALALYGTLPPRSTLIACLRKRASASSAGSGN